MQRTDDDNENPFGLIYSKSLTSVRDRPIGDREVDTGLEDDLSAGVTIDTNPNTGTTVTTRRGRDGEGTSDSGESSLWMRL